MKKRLRKALVIVTIIFMTIAGSACSETISETEEANERMSKALEDVTLGEDQIIDVGQLIECGDAYFMIPERYVSHEIPEYEGTYDRQAYVDEADAKVLQFYYMSKDEVGIGITDMIENVKAEVADVAVEYKEEEGSARLSFTKDEKNHEILLLDHEGNIYYFELASPNTLASQDFDDTVMGVKFK